MADSLRDLLLKSGIVKQIQSERVREPRHSSPGAQGAGKGKGNGGKSSPPVPRRSTQTQQEIDLAKAYAMRSQAENRERKQAEQEAAEQARLRRERKQKIQKLLEGKALNKAEAEHARNFEYGGKIRRVHVDSAQLIALNEGELGVVQHGGRYLLVSREIAEQVRDIDPRPLALLVDPNATDAGDDGVPDDLIW
ncbi:MAG TPA: DUF2058 family protein [Rhodanobacter sp.]|nr:DUF2058 family protein [Rhodanobacter sp.]